jgi:hypothetical protein
MALTVTPRNLLNRDTTPPTIDTPHPVHEEHSNRPQSNKLKSTGLQAIVLRTRLPATRANRTAVLTRTNAYLDRQIAPFTAKLH